MSSERDGAGFTVAEYVYLFLGLGALAFFMIAGMGSIIASGAQETGEACTIIGTGISYEREEVIFSFRIIEGARSADSWLAVTFDNETGEAYTNKTEREALGTFSRDCIMHFSDNAGVIIDAINSGRLPLG